MVIKFIPRISGGFVHHVLKDKKVKKLIEDLELSDQQAHNLTKSIVIAATRDLDIDVNNIINNVKDYAEAHPDGSQ